VLLAGEDLSRVHVCETVYDALATEPTVLVIEDLHWADAASVEVLRFLIRRIDALPLAMLITYRDEIGPQHSARPLLGDFAAVDGATTLRLPSLSIAGIAELLAGTSLDAARVHALTGGNAFFATEVAKDPDRPLPASVRDAVLARTAGVAPEDFEVLQLAATAPDRLDDRLLPALGVDLPTLWRLDETGLLLRSRGGRSSATSWPGWPSKARCRLAAPRDCTHGCSTHSNESSRRTWPRSPTMRSPPTTQVGPRSSRTPRPGRLPGAARTPRPWRSWRPHWPTSAPVGRPSGRHC
jgi:hypothetical protein